MANNTNGHDGSSGEFCFMCGRSDKQAGKMVYLPGGLKVSGTSGVCSST